MKQRVGRLLFRVIFIHLGATTTALAILIAAWLTLPMLTGTADDAFRDKVCKNANIAITKEVDADEQLGDLWRCSTVRFSVAPDPGRTSSPSVSNFSLSFLEFHENGTLAAPTQLADVKALLGANERSYVVTYVHGWRHNADRGNNDVRKFTILLSYLSQFLTQRCQLKIEVYCSMQVRGLYVGWRGATFREWGDGTEQEHLNNVLAAPTFIGRKLVSDGPLAGEVRRALRDIEASLDLRKSGGGGSDRMLVMGHSLGGNLLFQAFKDDLIASIETQAPTEIIQPPIGDLLVLLNPAASAAEWGQIGNAVERKSAALPKGTALFSPHQPPAVVALTGTCPFNKDTYDDTLYYAFDFAWTAARQIEANPNAELAQRRPKCDWVTSFAFPLAQLALLKPELERRTALGQLVPTSDRHTGVTHGFVTDSSARVGTSFSSSVNNATNRCPPAARGFAHATRRDWEVGVSVGRSARLTIQHGPLMYTSAARNPNWPQGFTISKAPITAANDPFWNAATHSNTIVEHGGFVSYVLWCTINKLVLDDPMG